MHKITYLCPPGNQGDVTSFLENICLGERDGVGLHRNLLHWESTNPTIMLMYKHQWFTNMIIHDILTRSDKNTEKLTGLLTLTTHCWDINQKHKPEFGPKGASHSAACAVGISLNVSTCKYMLWMKANIPLESESKVWKSIINLLNLHCSSSYWLVKKKMSPMNVIHHCGFKILGI